MVWTLRVTPSSIWCGLLLMIIMTHRRTNTECGDLLDHHIVVAALNDLEDEGQDVVEGRSMGTRPWQFFG